MNYCTPTGCLKEHILRYFRRRGCPDDSNGLIRRHRIWLAKIHPWAKKKPPRRGVGTGGWSAVGQRLVNGRSTVGQRSVNGRSTVGQRLVSGYIPDCPQTTVGPKMHFWEKNSLAPEKSIGAIWTPPTAELSQKMLLRQPAQGNDRAQAVRKPCVNAPSMRLQCALNAPSMRLQCTFNAP